jgi:glycosyltransferase involved in cell wall biosynthesis
LYDQVRGLVDRGHHVESWSPPTANRSFLPLNGLVEEHVVPFDWKPSERRDPIGRRLKPYLDMVARLEAMDRHCQVCAEQINGRGFDLLLAQPCQFFRSSTIGRHVDLPTAYYLQEPFRSLYEAWPSLPWMALPASAGRNPIRPLKAFLRDLIQVQSYRVQMREEFLSTSDYDLILVNSQFSRESVMRAFGLDSKVCYLGIDTDWFRPSNAPKENFVVGLGNILDNKGLGLAVAAVGTIEESWRPTLVWIGNFADPNYLKQIEDQAAGLGVTFVPKVNITDADLHDHLSRASAMIYTSRLEPFGYAPLEANACGTAVVAIAEGGVRESIRDGLNGTLVPDADPVALGRALRGYCSDPEAARLAGLEARRHVEEVWNLDSATDRLEGRLLELCRQERGASVQIGRREAQC